jgi:radical SAM protein with 4Fe4S-binding SPASM domain
MTDTSKAVVGHRLRLLKSYLWGSAVCPGLPPTGIIATTQRCNMTCRMCIRAVRRFDYPDMSFDLFKKIIDEWAPHLRYLSMDGLGETIMNPEAFRMVRYVKSKGIRVMFSTNATLLDADTAESIMDAPVDLIIFSVNGTTPETYRAVHGCDGYNAAMENIHRFLARKCKRKSSILVFLQMIRLPETLPQIKIFYRQWQSVPGVDVVRVKKDVVCNEGSCLNETRRRGGRNNPCARLWHGPPYVETNGDVYASPGVLFKAEPVGNLKEQRLDQIWNNERMQAMRRAHVSGEVTAFPECMECGYPRPLMPLILAGFLLDPFMAGRLLPLVEKLTFRHRLPLFEKPVAPSSDTE